MHAFAKQQLVELWVKDWEVKLIIVYLFMFWLSFTRLVFVG